MAHNNLGVALRDKGQLDQAIVEYRKAIHLKKDLAAAHYNLGYALKAKGQLDEAIAECREAIRLRANYPEAHFVLGDALQEKGEFQEALKPIRRGHELGARNPRWPYPSAQWLRNAEQLAELDVRLPQFLNGKAQPADAG